MPQQTPPPIPEQPPAAVEPQRFDQAPSPAWASDPDSEAAFDATVDRLPADEAAALALEGLDPDAAAAPPFEDLPATETSATDATSGAFGSRAGDASDTGSGDPGVPPSVTPSVVAPALASASPEQGDWLDRICPYLLSEDGSYRSTRPDEGHRCTAQDPPDTLPLAFQERFCLTDRHVRCEMFKHAQAARTATLEQAGGSVAQVQSARFKPSVRSVPLALGPSEDGNDDDRSRRPVILGAAAVGGAILFILLVILLSGGPDRGGARPTGSSTPQPAATRIPTPAATLDSLPSATLEAGATPAPAVTPAAVDGGQLIEYEVQEGELLEKIAENFGTTRRRIIRANDGMADKSPYVEVGDIIVVPAASDMTVEELESFLGYVGPAE